MNTCYEEQPKLFNIGISFKEDLKNIEIKNKKNVLSWVTTNPQVKL